MYTHKSKCIHIPRAREQSSRQVAEVQTAPHVSPAVLLPNYLCWGGYLFTHGLFLFQCICTCSCGCSLMVFNLVDAAHSQGVEATRSFINPRD